MNEDKNIVDFAARAALERGRRTGYLLDELDGRTLASILEAAYIDCRLDSDGDCVARDELTVVVSVDAERDLFRLLAYFTTSGTREQVLEFCNRFNAGLLMARAQVHDTPNSQGQWLVIIDHDRLVFEDERLEARTIVKLVRRFEYVVRNGMMRFDADRIF
jgi:hypothetical protein